MNIEGKRLIWQEYQKEIADDKYFYVRSCVRQTFFPGSEVTFLRILRDELGKDVYENLVTQPVQALVIIVILSFLILL